MTVGELIKWILENKRGRAFKDWTQEQIVSAVCSSIETGSIIYTTENNQFTGVALFVKDIENKVAETGPVLTVTRSALPQIVAYFKQNYPDWTLQIHSRNGGYMKDSNRFMQKILARKM